MKFKENFMEQGNLGTIYYITLEITNLIQNYELLSLRDVLFQKIVLWIYICKFKNESVFKCMKYYLDILISFFPSVIWSGEGIMR